MQSAPERIEIPYSEAHKHILDADVLLYTRKGVVYDIIKIGTLSKYAHAAMAGWADDEQGRAGKQLLAYEMVAWGPHDAPLVEQVEQHPGTIDVYRVSDTHSVYTWDEKSQLQIGRTKTLDRQRAVSIMRGFCLKGRYGMLHLFRTMLLRFPVVRVFMRQPTNDQLEDHKHPPHCSGSVAYALRHAFTDVVKHMPDDYTSPGDLARSPLLHYMFTLTN